MKAVLYNNLSSCYCKFGNYEEAESLNDNALVEDPFSKVYYRKCLILEAKGEIIMAINLASQSIEDYSHEFESD